MRSIFNASILLISLGITAANGASVRFLSQMEGVMAHFADNAVSLKTRDAAVRVEFAGAGVSPAASLAGDTGAYRDPWPGIEVQYAPYRQTLKSEYHAAGADPELIGLRYESTKATPPSRHQSARILQDGSLAIWSRRRRVSGVPTFCLPGARRARERAHSVSQQRWYRRVCSRTL
jgi:hypothetical protein